jgi:GT2 family glycosyltransferase
MTDLSVIIVNYNTKDLLRDCLQSLREHLTRPSNEIFVVDNGSEDDSTTMIRKEFPWVRLIENTGNLGFARANNQAMRKASGRFILLLNSDTLIRKGAIEGLLKTMQSDPSIGIAGLQLLNGDGSLQNSIYNSPSLLTELTNKSLLRRLFPNRYRGKEHKILQPIEVDGIIGSCMLVRKEAIGEVGVLDEDYFFFFEETDWCLRMRRAGWKVVFDPRYTIFHLQGKSAAQVNTRARIEYWRSRYTYFEKHFDAISCHILKIGLLTRLALDICLAGVAGFFSPRRAGSQQQKLATNSSILQWHRRGCPSEGGLQSVSNVWKRL